MSGYTNVTFLLCRANNFDVVDTSKSGLIIRQDSNGKVVNVAVDGDTYNLDAVVFGQSSTSNFGDCRWNVMVTGGTQGTLTLNGTHLGKKSTDYGYGSSPIEAGALYGMKHIPGNTTTFDAAAAISVSAYQINDAHGQPITNATFSACIKGTHGDLTNFDFWDSQKNKLNKVDGGHELIWIDSDATGKFSFYVTSNLAGGMYSDTLAMTIGNERPDLAQVIVGDPDSVGPNSALPPPVPDLLTGSDLYLDSSISILEISIGKLSPGQIQPGDTLILMVNGKQNLNSFFVATNDGTSNGFPGHFALPVSALNLAGDAKNVLEYMVLRGSTIALSSECPFRVHGASGSSTQPFPSNSQYLAPIIVGNEGYLDIDFDMVEDGLPVKISWAGAEWAPVSGDVLTLSIVFNGWNVNESGDQVANIPFPAIAPADLTNKYISQVIDYKYFAGFIEGPGGKKSTVFMQYQVPDDGTNAPGYSTPTPAMNIDTVPPGGL